MTERLIASVGETDELRRRMQLAVYDVPEQPHRDLSREDVVTLRGAGLDELAVLAEEMLDASEKRRRWRFWRS